MARFNENDKVITIENGKVREGIVRKDFSVMSPPVLLVEFENGSLEKVSFDRVAHAPKPEPQDQKPNEPIEKSEITITSEEFKNIGLDLITKMAIETKDFLLGMKLSAFLAMLHTALFNGESEK
jgi:hypothetical protein